jgi:transposase
VPTWRCLKGEQDDFAVAARVRTTRRLRTQIDSAIGKAARSVSQVAAAHSVWSPTAHRTFIAHAETLLAEPAPTLVLGC